MALGVVSLWCIVMGCLAGPALAARGHVFSRAFGESGSGEGQFKEPAGVATNYVSGDVYVVDKGNNRVERFGAAGAFVGQFNGSGLLGEGGAAGSGGRPGETETGQFLTPEGIAVDNACVLHKPALTESTAPTCAEFDPSNGDVYVVDTGHSVIDKYTATGQYVAQLTETTGGAKFAELEGVATSKDGHVWVYQGSREIDRFDDSAANAFVPPSVTSHAEGFPHPGFAVGSQGELYVVHRLGKLVAKLNGAGEVLSEELDGEEASAVAVDLASNDVYIAKPARVDVFSPGGASLLERLGEGRLSNAGGVGVNGASETVYVSDASANVVDIFTPQLPSVPSVESESVTNVTAGSAKLHAEVNPRGAATEYRFEFGRCAASGCAGSGYEQSLPVPDGFVGSDFGIHSVGAWPQNLTGGTLYHFRVIAHNELDAPGTVIAGEEREFTTQSAGGKFVLADGREWELVSPPDKHGALIETIGEGQVTQAAADGRGVSYVAVRPTESNPQGYSNLVQVVSTRGATGWSTRDITPPHLSATKFSASEGQEYRLFSEDLSTAVVQPFGSLIPDSSPFALAPGEASEQTAFLRSVYSNGNPSEPCASSCYRPLVTGAAGHANVPEGTVFGGCGEVMCGPLFAGATADLSHIVLSSSVALTKTAAPGGGLYEWSAGKLALVSMLPGNKEAAGVGTRLGLLGTSARNAISADGSRIFWSEHGGHLYLRDMALEETVQLDAVQGGDGTGLVAPAFEFASSDGSRVFFTDNQRLTADSGASSSEADLYACDIVHGVGGFECRLTDLTPALEGVGADVRNNVLGASEDGSWVYFVANSLRAEGAVHGSCNGFSSLAGSLCNLYVAHFNGTKWATSLVAVLSAEDFPDWNGGGSLFPLARMTARVSSSGRWLAFMSQRGLTGYDTRDAVTGKPAEEVYLYDAARERLLCASCNPSGARPKAVEYGKLRYGLDGLEVWPNAQGLAASVPAWTSFTTNGEARYQPRYLSDKGRLFFNSSDGLVSQDVNGTGDVYEFEPEGVGGCTSSLDTPSVMFVKQLDGHEVGGCVGLISSGSSAEEAGFLDASESGGDVFFLTAAPLSSRDFDTSLDVYDAHECTTAVPCLPASSVSPPPCSSGDSCKPPPSPQPEVFGAPATATFSGESNVAPAVKPATKPLTRAQKLARALKACHGKRRKQRAACERQARARYAAKQSRKVKASKRGRA